MAVTLLVIQLVPKLGRNESSERNWQSATGSVAVGMPLLFRSIHEAPALDENLGKETSAAPLVACWWPPVM